MDRCLCYQSAAVTSTICISCQTMRKYVYPVSTSSPALSFASKASSPITIYSKTTRHSLQRNALFALVFTSVVLGHLVPVAALPPIAVLALYVTTLIFPHLTDGGPASRPPTAEEISRACRDIPTFSHVKDGDLCIHLGHVFQYSSTEKQWVERSAFRGEPGSIERTLCHN